MGICCAQPEPLPTPAQLEALQEKLGYRFRDLALLRQACFHPSAGAETQGKQQRWSIVFFR